MFGLWPVRLKGDVWRVLTCEGTGKVDVWTVRCRLAVADSAGDHVEVALAVTAEKERKARATAELPRCGRELVEIAHSLTVDLDDEIMFA